MQPDIDTLDKPKHDGPQVHEFKCIDYEQENFILIWRMPTILNKLQTPEPWLGFEYWDSESRRKAANRTRFTTGLLNGIRQHGDLITGDF